MAGTSTVSSRHACSTMSLIIPTFIYFLSIGIYLHPLTSAPIPSRPPNSRRRWTLIYNPKPQLDEIHTMAKENHDVNPQPTTSWTDAWKNDYWGRPISSESSHKSWRPVAVWSFRFLKGGRFGSWSIALVGKAIGGVVEGLLGMMGTGLRRSDETYTSTSTEGEDIVSELFLHRVVNVLIHAALVQIVGAVATLLFSHNPSSNPIRHNLQLCTKYISQLLFALHPVHVEAVANMANRPHILALLMNATIVDPHTPFLALTVLAILGLLTAETALFQYPAIVLTMTAIRYRELSLAEKTRGQEKTQKSLLIKSVFTLVPRYIILCLVSTMYVIYRHKNDILSIPAGLIRPAENPFYDKIDKDEWTLGRRIMNYSYILSVHVMKSFGVEIIGSSHEYGYDCIPEIQSYQDYRLLLPTALLFLFDGVFAWSLNGWKISWGSQLMKQQGKSNERVLLVLVFFSWIASLFPIAGFLKVGTLVADRIVMASSFGSCIFIGRVLAIWTVPNVKRSDRMTKISKMRLLTKVAMLSLLMMTFASRTHNRVAEWMDSLPLMESSLKACPRSIKSNLEASKMYSGLMPHELDLEKSLSLIKTAQSIDPTYCDVHQQYAYVYYKQAKWIEFEKEMVQSLLCPYTMTQALNYWKEYWKVALKGGQNTAAQKRYNKHMAKLKFEVEKEDVSPPDALLSDAKDEL